MLVVGPTHAGKSFFINHYADPKLNNGLRPKIGEHAASTTDRTTQWNGRLGDRKLVLWDTPGLGDSEGRDVMFLDQLVSALHKHPEGIHHVLFLVPITDSVVGGFLKTCLQVLLSMAPELRDVPVLTLVRTKANAAHRSYWEQMRLDFAPVVRLFSSDKLKLHNLDVIECGTGNWEAMDDLLLRMDSSVVLQTDYMRSAATLKSDIDNAKLLLENATTELDQAKAKAEVAEAELKRLKVEKEESRKQQEKLVQRIKELEQLKKKEGGESGCFAFGSVVAVKEDMESAAVTTPIENVKIGQFVECLDLVSKKMSFTPVLSIVHNAGNEKQMKVLNMKFKTSAGRCVNLSVTETHLLVVPSNDGEKYCLRESGKIFLGASVVLADFECAALESVSAGYVAVCNPLTLSGYIVVDGVAASVHSVDHHRFQAVTSPLRALYRICPSLLSSRMVKMVVHMFDAYITPVLEQ